MNVTIFPPPTFPGSLRVQCCTQDEAVFPLQHGVDFRISAFRCFPPVVQNGALAPTWATALGR
eukprot:9491165-Pyramimonas_sp.AAC.1